MTDIRSRSAARLVHTCWIAVVWLILWGSTSTGDLLAGLAVGAGVSALLADHGPQRLGALRPRAALRLAGFFAVALVTSSVAVTRRVCAPRMRVQPAVVSVRLPATSPAVLTVVANAITLTPGTLTLDVAVADDGHAELIVHALDAPDPDAVRTDVRRLHALATAAFGAPPIDTAEVLA